MEGIKILNCDISVTCSAEAKCKHTRAYGGIKKCSELKSPGKVFSIIGGCVYGKALE